MMKNDLIYTGVFGSFRLVGDEGDLSATGSFSVTKNVSRELEF